MPHLDSCSTSTQSPGPIASLSTSDPPRKTLDKSSHTALDAQILARCAGGDEEAMADIHARLGGMLLALAMRITRDWRDAEDTVQEALLYAWKKAGSYDPSKASVSTWLVLITRSRALDRIRKKRTMARAETPLTREDASIGIDPEGFGRALQTDRSKRIRAALELLSDDQKDVLELQFFHGLTQKEGAFRLGIPLGTFKTRVLLAIRKLRRELREELSEIR